MCIRDRFKAGEVGALESALEDVLAAREQWPRIREQARRFVESERTWANSVARYDAVYQRALNRPGRLAAAST